MEFGLFLEFPAPEGYTDQESFAQGFTMVDEAESMGVDSVFGWPNTISPRSASCPLPSP